MKVLIACEESQAVTIEFRKLGHEAFSCDLQDCSGGYPEWHINGDAIETLWGGDWDLVIAHPPCTRIANSGVYWLYERNLWRDLAEAVGFFNQFIVYGRSGKRIAIENPIPHSYAGLPKYTQLIQPWQFGHGETKATCLWLFDLMPLRPTDMVEGREQKLYRLPPGHDRAKERSKTFPGIAKAMAEQWGGLIKSKVA